MSRFIPQTILISGATGGIGSALARSYATPDTSLILTGRNTVRLEELTQQCQQKGARVIAHAFDITDSKLLAAWLKDVMDTCVIDLVIANAGISLGTNPQGQLECLSKTEYLFQVNLLAVIQMIHPIIQAMKQRRSGQIALMSSLASFRGLPQSPAYCASKAALRVYGESLRALLRREGVQVCVICPGFIQTAMSDKLSGPKPYLMTADAAAKIIQKKLQKKCDEITFPYPLKLSINLLNALPKRLADYVLVKIKTSIKEI